MFPKGPGERGPEQAETVRLLVVAAILDALALASPPNGGRLVNGRSRRRWRVDRGPARPCALCVLLLLERPRVSGSTKKTALALRILGHALRLQRCLQHHSISTPQQTTQIVPRSKQPARPSTSLAFPYPGQYRQFVLLHCHWATARAAADATLRLCSADQGQGQLATDRADPRRHSQRCHG